MTGSTNEEMMQEQDQMGRGWRGRSCLGQRW